MDKIYLINGEVRDSLFSKDNFGSRRTTGHNLYDPESLLTGAEIQAGFGYEHPRVWNNEYEYLDACEGFISVDEIPNVAPRTRLDRKVV